MAVAAVQRGDSTTEESGESSPADRGAAPRLGALFRLEARSAGHGADWRAYAAGRLLLPGRAAAPPGLLAEPVPTDRAAAAEAAARWRLDPDLFWLIVRDALER